MRNVVFALLFANLAYFAWARWVDVPKPPPVNETISRLPRLKLASEQPTGQSAPATPSKTSLNCTSVGPFADVDTSARAAAVLKSHGFEGQQRAGVGEPTRDFQVFVTGFRSEEEAARAARRLQGLNFRDAVAVWGGAQVAARVSVGTFGDRARAEARLAQLKAQGFKGEIGEQSLRAALYWVDVTPPATGGAVPLNELFAAGVKTGLSVQPCPVALPKTMSADLHQPPTAPASHLP